MGTLLDIYQRGFSKESPIEQQPSQTPPSSVLPAMELHLHSVGLLPHAFKCGFAQAQYSEALPLKLTQAPAVQLSILVIVCHRHYRHVESWADCSQTSHSIDVVPLQKACGPPHPALLGHCAADVVDRYQMSPGDGKPGVVDKLANEALQSLLELKSLADQVKQARGKLAGLVRYVLITFLLLDGSANNRPSHSWEREQLAPTLAELSKVQCETETSIELSGRVIRSHGDFCRYMHETLQHAAAERDHHLAQDSSVIVAGSVVIDSLTVLGKHVMAVQGALHDVAREFRDLGEKAHHRVKHPLIHHLWKKIWPVLIDVVKMTMLVISCIGKVLGLFHPVASIIGEGAGRVHKYFDEHFSNCIHGHNSKWPSIRLVWTWA